MLRSIRCCYNTYTMLNIIKQAANEGGTILKKYFQTTELDVVNKTTHQNIVTKADIESQTRIKDYIVNALKEKGVEEKDIGFIGEEELHTLGDHTFIIDPLDGTSNFATGLEDFCVLIAYLYKGELESGVMYFPEKEYCYFAEKGKGAKVEKHGKEMPLQIAGKKLQNTFLYSSLSSHDDINTGLGEKLLGLKNYFRGIRMVGAAGWELALLTENIAGAVVLASCSIWDIAPGKLILEELGYKMYDWEGEMVQFDLGNPKKKYPFFACDPQYAKEIAQVMKY